MLLGVLCIVSLCLTQCNLSASASVVPITEAPAAQPSPPSDDLDDDYVPYKPPRHSEFDFQLMKVVLSGQPTSNVILSPFAVKMLMSVLAEAAGKGTVTERELANVLPDVNSNPLAREFYTRVLRSLQEPSNDYDFKIATNIFANSFITPRQRFASIAESYYFTRIEVIDFGQPAAAAQTINKWVAEATHNRICNLVDEQQLEQAALVLLNAMYFNAYWRHPFNVNETIDAPFFVPAATKTGTADATEVQRTSFMQTTDTFFYLQSEQLDAKVLRLPYKGRRFSMTLILPNRASESALDELIARLDSESLRRAQYYMDEYEVRVQLPKFRFDYTAPLIPALRQLGIQSIFTNEASLPNLVRGQDSYGRLQVSQVLQKAGIEVSEKGSTAYAATAVVISNKFGGDTSSDFIANRPFVFLIEDETTGTVLFAGKVCNPADFTAATTS